MTETFTTNSAEETIELGRSLAAQLAPPKLVTLTGDLGAGKTTLIKGIAEGLGAAEQDAVSSPTFTLVQEYRGATVDIFHIDLYRVDTPRELETVGLDDLLSERSLLLIEWAEKFERFRNERDVAIRIERTGPEQRTITVATRTDSI